MPLLTATKQGGVRRGGAFSRNRNLLLVLLCVSTLLYWTRPGIYNFSEGKGVDARTAYAVPRPCLSGFMHVGCCTTIPSSSAQRIQRHCATVRAVPSPSPGSP